MKLTDADKLITILQGIAAGNKLQMLNNSGVWVDYPEEVIGFTNDISKYRTVPVQKKLYVLRLINNAGEVSSGVFGTFTSLKSAHDTKNLFNNHNLVIETYTQDEKVT